MSLTFLLSLFESSMFLALFLSLWTRAHHTAYQITNGKKDLTVEATPSSITPHFSRTSCSGLSTLVNQAYLLQLRLTEIYRRGHSLLNSAPISKSDCSFIRFYSKILFYSLIRLPFPPRLGIYKNSESLLRPYIFRLLDYNYLSNYSEFGIRI